MLIYVSVCSVWICVDLCAWMTCVTSNNLTSLVSICWICFNEGVMLCFLDPSRTTHAFGMGPPTGELNPSVECGCC